MAGGKISSDLFAVLYGESNTAINASGGVLNGGGAADYCINRGIVNISGTAVLTGGTKGILHEPYAATITGGTFDYDPSEWVDVNNYDVTCVLYSKYIGYISKAFCLYIHNTSAIYSKCFEYKIAADFQQFIYIRLEL